MSENTTKSTDLLGVEVPNVHMMVLAAAGHVLAALVAIVHHKASLRWQQRQQRWGVISEVVLGPCGGGGGTRATCMPAATAPAVRVAAGDSCAQFWPPTRTSHPPTDLTEGVVVGVPRVRLLHALVPRLPVPQQQPAVECGCRRAEEMLRGSRRQWWCCCCKPAAPRQTRRRPPDAALGATHTSARISRWA